MQPTNGACGSLGFVVKKRMKQNYGVVGNPSGQPPTLQLRVLCRLPVEDNSPDEPVSRSLADDRGNGKVCPVTELPVPEGLSMPDP